MRDLFFGKEDIVLRAFMVKHSALNDDLVDGMLLEN